MGTCELATSYLAGWLLLLLILFVVLVLVLVLVLVPSRERIVLSLSSFEGTWGSWGRVRLCVCVCVLARCNACHLCLPRGGHHCTIAHVGVYVYAAVGAT